jgi:hypothetical protein
MAKITNPLHSLAASGTVGGTFSFRQTSRGSVCTKKAHSYPQTSEAQLLNQQKMRDARAAYLTLNATDLSYWQQLASTRRRSKWLCFFAEYIYQNIEPPNAPLIPDPQVYGQNITPQWF